MIASTKPFVIYSANKETGVVSGFSFSKQVAPNVDKFFFHLRTLWSMQFVSGVETIATLGARPSYEAINSVGRVLGNRDVLYKYLNPNMISIATITEKPTRTLTIYAVDSITGNVIFKTSQEKVGPANTVHLVQCENWIVYHYWNAKVRRNEFAVFELFEDESRSNR